MDGRKVLLILGNYTAHIPFEKLAEHNVTLRNTMLLYLPLNATSKIQPSDAGIIRNFKVYYRRRSISLLLDCHEKNIDELEKITVLEGIRLAMQARKSVACPEIIIICLHHCKIRNDACDPTEPLTILLDDL